MLSRTCHPGGGGAREQQVNRNWRVKIGRKRCNLYYVINDVDYNTILLCCIPNRRDSYFIVSHLQHNIIIYINVLILYTR